MKQRVLVIVATALVVLAAAKEQGDSPALAVPANDNFANAITLVATATDPVVASGSNAGATTQSGEPTACFTDTTVWYNWSPGFSGTVSLDAYGGDLDTVLGVYTGNAVNALTAIGCNDQFGGPQGGISFNFAASTTYWIQVGGYFGATGSFVLNLSMGASMVVNTATDSTTPDNFLSLREAILAAVHPSSPCAILSALEQQQVLNCGGGGLASADLIHFNPGEFPPGAPASILLGSSLPAMASGDTISGIGAGVVVDGQSATAFACFTISGSSNSIQGMDIRGCARGVIISAGSSNLVGINISSPTPLPQQRNIIRENGRGVSISSTGGGNLVYGNYIGTNPAGAAGLGNGPGVYIEGPAFQQIGSAGLGRNVVSGNSIGVYITGGNTQTVVNGNYIGTNPAGTAALGNDQDGVFIADANAASVSNNLISGNLLGGIRIAPSFPGSGWASNNVIQGNLIGTDVTGTVLLPNDDPGITLSNASRNTIGGTATNQRNVISGNNYEGVVITGAYATRNSVLGNYIGTNAAGTAALANGSDGVTVTANATSNTVGGSVPGARNLISGNFDGVFLQGPGGGVSTYASTDVPKAINDFAATISTITVPELATVTDVDVLFDITHTYTADLTIQLRNPDGMPVILASGLGGGGDNYTNTYLDDDPVPGIRIIDVSPPFTGSFLPQTPLSQLDGSVTRGDWTLTVYDGAGADVGSLNSWSLRFTTNGNEVAGNYIGTNAAGTHALGNSPGVGVLIVNSPSNTIGGSTAGARNVISGSTNQGVEIVGAVASNNRVVGNYIGTDAAGTVDLGNGTSGVTIDGAPYNTIGGGQADRNIISGNNSSGVQISGAGAVGNAVMSNYIGTNAAGNADLGNTLHGVYVTSAGANTIGAPISAGNVISGNDQSGIRLLANTVGGLIQANFIGTDAAGTQAIPNAQDGIFILGGSSFIQVGGANQTERNVISGNVGHGIDIQQPGTSSITIHGNYIGTKVDGVSPLGNGAGIGISGGASNNRIGGTNPGEGNTIAYNATRGIGLLSSGGFDPLDNRYQRNSIFSNGGLGIDLNQDGVTANDAGDGDSGPNGLQNFPELEYGSYSGGSTVNIVGALNTTPNGAFRVEFFSSLECDLSGHGEGATFLGDAYLSTDATGHVSFVASFASPPLTGFLTSVAIDDDATYNASEFSNCIPASATGDDDGDGYTNAVEFGSIMCLGAVNNDSFEDATVNDGCPGGPPQVGAYSEASFKIGTNPVYPCGGSSWPSDLVSSGGSANKLDIFDLVSFVAPVRLLDKSPGPGSPYNPRWDLAPGPNTPFPNFISILDITTMLSGVSGSPAYPPMLGGQRAFGKECPLAAQ